MRHRVLLGANRIRLREEKLEVNIRKILLPTRSTTLGNIYSRKNAQNHCEEPSFPAGTEGTFLFPNRKDLQVGFRVF